MNIRSTMAVLLAVPALLGALIVAVVNNGDGPVARAEQQATSTVDRRSQTATMLDAQVQAMYRTDPNWSNYGKHTIDRLFRSLCSEMRQGHEVQPLWVDMIYRYQVTEAGAWTALHLAADSHCPEQAQRINELRSVIG